MNQAAPSGHYFAVVRSLESDLYTQWGFPGGASGKEPSSQSRICKRLRFDPWVRKIPERRAWQPTPVFPLPGKSHGQRSLASYSPWGCKRVGQDSAAKQQQSSASLSLPPLGKAVSLPSFLSLKACGRACFRYKRTVTHAG